MRDQELEYHVRKLETAFNAAPRAKRDEMKPGITRMIRSLKQGDQRLPLSLMRIERQMDQEMAEDLFDNVPV